MPVVSHDILFPRDDPAHMHTGVSPKNFQATQKYHYSFSNPKKSAHFIFKNLHMSMKYPETMKIEVMIASSGPRNFSSTIFDVIKYNEHNFSFNLTQKHHFWQNSNSKISELLPHICACAECPLGFCSSYGITLQCAYRQFIIVNFHIEHKK